MKRGGIELCLLLLWSVFAFPGCGGGSAASGGESSAGPTPGGATASLAVAVWLPARADVLTTAIATQYTLRVRDVQTFSDVVPAVPFTRDQDRITVFQVPLGRKQVLVEGTGDDLQVLERGTALVDVGAGSNAVEIQVFPVRPVGLVFGTQPMDVVVGQVLTPGVAVQIVDSQGNLVTDASNPVTLSLGSNPGSANLSGTLTVNANQGVALFSDLSLDQVASGYTLTASSAGLPMATSQPFDVLPGSPGPPAQLSFGTQPGDVEEDTVIQPPITVRVLDAAGTLVTTASNPVTLQLQVNPGGSVLSGTLTVNAVNGVATFPDLSLDMPGTGYQLQATSPSLSAATSGTFDVLMSANLVNGSFESPVMAPGTFQLFPPGDPGIPGWTVFGPPSSNVGIVHTSFTQIGFTFPAQDGNQWNDLTGASAAAGAGVRQSVGTVVGQTYELSFWVGNVFDSGGIFGTTSTVDVFIDGVPVLSATNSSGGTTLTWEEFTTTFVATSTSTEISLQNGDPPADTNCGLDNVTISVVP
ncbi:MAG: DUF642 domain-containing protein [Armatimonadetes bacterium]|nr:DUF642 domain-containing protein [Armatimonadota bacterium]